MSTTWTDRARDLKPCVRNFIGGKWQLDRDARLLEKYGPRDGRLLYSFGAADSRDVRAAVASARNAFEDGRWSDASVQHRKEVLYRLAALLEERREELALLETLDVGKPIANALELDVPAAAALIRFNAEAADKHYGKVYASDKTSLLFQLHRPLGVVAGIVGWNFPLLLAAGKIGPALAMGNSLILKPSELTSLSTSRVAELAIQAGVPEGVLNVVHGDGAVGSALALDEDVDLVTFTGSTHTGKKLLVASGNSNMKRLLLECGGKAPNIVFDDCPNLEAVADAVIGRAFYNQGQVCTASSRLLIQESIKGRLMPMLIERISTLVLGDPLEPDTRFGAVVSGAHRDKVKSYIEEGKSGGARVAYGSNASPPHAAGFYVSPVIFDDVSPTQRVAREEIFGPVLSVIAFCDEEDAIRIANDTIYGLSAILWTRDLGRAHRVSRGINAGWIVVNATGRPLGGPSPGVLAVGGHKQSGIGSEGGIEGLEYYTSSTAVQFYV
jgi:acyl-CoA reductase-like NAD-dependent aldehyde dehydrogenase